MKEDIISLKDFELSSNENVIKRSQNFQSYIDQMEQGRFNFKMQLRLQI